ncbi:tail fiber domain-containing protein [Sphingopyxis panaciterrulae]|uniref:Peptidase S74 domain-containing protein n=1 Tax=Sphingopyxis panaciterrulae TaxID=462372 RepID=A0A7W9EQP5_9SPHN|nr:hypothetical protein [Sphingopyxis panaciterrulae]MBB5705420.1 hypothetical protein [Sphingopyxis panaciterrulae]
MPTLFFADLVRELCQEGGSGPLTPSGAVPGHRRFADAVPPGAGFHYAIAGVAQPDQWEAGTGRIDADGRLQRDSVAASSAGNAFVDFAPGLKTIALTVGAGWFAASDAAAAMRDEALARTVRRDASGRYALDGALAAADGSAGAPALAFAADGDSGLYRPAADALAIATAGSERLRVTASGHVGIGTSLPDAPLTVSGECSATRMRVSASGADAPAYGFNGAAGLGFYRYSGSAIGFAADGVNIGAFSAGILRAGTDNGALLGSGAIRWSVVYAATGAINTSDGREKTWQGAASAAELAAAARIARELGFYCWNDAIAAKGADGARRHFGVRAQAVWAIMAEEGLIAPLAEGQAPDSRYAFLCWDGWEEERDAADRPVRAAGDRFGIRPDQLALFLIAAQEARLAALEAAA